MILLSRVALISFLLAFYAEAQAAAQAAEILLPRDSSKYLGESVRYLHTQSSLEWIDALRDIRNQSFLSEQIPNFGYKKGEHWFHFSVLSEKQAIYYFSYEYPLMQNITIFKLRDGQVLDTRTGGKLTSTDEREVKDRNHIFRFRLENGETSEFLIRLKTSGAVSLPLKIYSEESYPYERSIEFFLFALYFGAIASLILYNLFLSLSIGQSSYLFYSGYLTAIGLVHFFLFGFANLILFPAGGYLNEVGTVVVTGISFVFLLLFARSYLSIELRSRLNLCVVLPFLMFNMIVIFGGLFFYGTASIRQTGLTAILSPLCVLFLSVVCVKRGSIEARFLLAGMLSFILGSLMYGLKDYALISKNSITEHGAAVGTAIEAVLLSLGLAYKYKTLQGKNAELRVLNASSSAISSMVAAISHDVRKPFATLRVILDALQTIRDPAEVRSFATMAIPEVQRSSDYIDGLLLDVMQISDEVKLNFETVSPESILTAVFVQIFRGQPEADVKIMAQLEDDLALRVDAHKSQRIFANIIENACQAIGWKGSIWIRARKDHDRVHFTVGNAGSFIPKESLGRLFEAFYSRDKRGGTGLGLAIAKKWTEGHGGSILCRSVRDEQYPEGIVEFHFDLPSVELTPLLSRPGIREHSREYRMVLGLDAGQVEADRFTTLASELMEEVARLNRPLKVFIVDDEKTILQSIEKTLVGLNFSNQLRLEAFDHPDRIPKQQCDLLLVDFDLSLPDRNGLDVIRAYKSREAMGLVCLHTNRFESQTFKAALESGADSVYLKPMTAEHLIKILREAARRAFELTDLI